MWILVHNIFVGQEMPNLGMLKMAKNAKILASVNGHQLCHKNVMHQNPHLQSVLSWYRWLLMKNKH